MIADRDNNRIRRVDAGTGRITTVAGTGDSLYNGDGQPANAAALGVPGGVAVDTVGNLLIADSGSGRIRRVDAATGRITTVAGGGAYNGDDQPATTVRLFNPSDVVVTALGDLFIADPGYERIRRVDAATSRITTVAGTGNYGYNGDDKPATAAQLLFPSSVAVDAAGNLFIADSNNNRVRRVDARTGLITTVAGTGVGAYNGDGQPATAAQLNVPWSVTLDAVGNLIIADTGSSRVRRVDAGTGRITTVAGTEFQGYNGDDQPATTAALNVPYGVAVDNSGNLFIADTLSNRIRRVDAGTGRITTVAGTGVGGYDGDDQPATAAQLNIPFGVAVDVSGNLFIPDNNRIRRVDAGAGRITTVAGTGVGGYDGDDQPATAAQLSAGAVAVDTSGNIFIAGDNRIRRVDAGTGRITTVAGTGVQGYDGDDRAATMAHLYAPIGMTVDASGNLFIADSGNGAIRVVKGPLTGGGGVPSPSLHSVSYVLGGKRLTITGSGFGSTRAQVRVNGTDLSSRIRKQTDIKITLRGTAEQLGLVPGDNEVTVMVDGRTSATFVLRV